MTGSALCRVCGTGRRAKRGGGVCNNPRCPTVVRAALLREQEKAAEGHIDDLLLAQIESKVAYYDAPIITADLERNIADRASLEAWSQARDLVVADRKRQKAERGRMIAALQGLDDYLDEGEAITHPAWAKSEVLRIVQGKDKVEAGR